MPTYLSLTARAGIVASVFLASLCCVGQDGSHHQAVIAKDRLTDIVSLLTDNLVNAYAKVDEQADKIDDLERLMLAIQSQMTWMQSRITELEYAKSGQLRFAIDHGPCCTGFNGIGAGIGYSETPIVTNTPALVIEVDGNGAAHARLPTINGISSVKFPTSYTTADVELIPHD